MNFAFLFPAGLAALAALALPLLIHLARRSEQRPTVFAALEWLRARPRPRARIRFDEWLLLATRLLLLALIALLIAQPVVSGVDDDAPVVFVAAGAQVPAANAFPAEARVHWLAPGFPAYGVREPPTGGVPVSSLLRELDADLPADARVTVLVPPVLDGVDAQRPKLGRTLDWRIVPGRALRATPMRSVAAPQLVIRHAPTHGGAVRYLRAANAAWGNATPADVADVATPFDPRTRHLAWLAPGPVPAVVQAWVQAGGVAVLDVRAEWPDALPMSPLWRERGDTLVEGAASGRGRVLRLTRELTPQAMPVLLDGAFPVHLRAALEPPPAMPARVSSAAHAPLTGAPRFVPAPRDLQPWLVLAIALLFAVERWLATARRGRDAP